MLSVAVCLFMDPVLGSFPFYMTPVRSYSGTNVARVGSATETRSQTGLSSFLGLSHVNEWRGKYGDRNELIPVWVCPGLV